LAVSAASGRLEIGFDAPAAVRAGLASMGRTEDVRFAPSGRRLGFACYAREQIAIADVEIGVAAGRPEIAVTSFSRFGSAELSEPHGIDFLDDNTLIVGNRAGGVTVFGLPIAGSDDELSRVGQVSGGTTALDAPGSVAVRWRGSGRAEVLACNNWTNTITRYPIGVDGVLAAGQVIARKWLDLPDGLAISHDDRWLAVSNHNSHCVLIFELATLSERSDPIGVLRGVRYPHGLRFSSGDRYLLVADAGAPYVHTFASRGDSWYGVGYPAATIRVMDDEAFARGRASPEEGGPKGLDLDSRTNVLVVTSEHQPLACFDMATALDRDERAEDELVQYELSILADAERLKREAAQAVAEAREEIRALQQSKAWRLMQPARRAYTAALRLKPGR
jgi:hypothetical protein